MAYTVNMVHGSSICEDWSDLQTRRFTPARIELLVGVPTALQRKWVQLHLRNAETSSEWWEVISGRRRFTWSGAQFFQFFRDATQDLGTMSGMGTIHAVDELDVLKFEPAFAIIHSNIFGVDHRNREQGDLFVFRSLSGTAPSGFYSASMAGLGRVLADASGDRLYTYNISAMQRRLAQRVVSVENVEGRLEAAPSAAGPG
jgi:hypothetical protein